jgi:archaetidylinositol phosphate synthase
MDERKKAKRVLRTLTSRYEKPLLIWMANRLPAWITPDHLTVLGIFAALVIFAGLTLIRVSPWWVLLSDFGFLLHWWADSLDGTLARVRHRERERYGHFVDHICDAFTTAVICIGLGISTLVHPGIGLAVAIGYLLMNIYAHVVSYVDNVFQISYGRFGPTEVRIVAVTGTTVFAFWNPFLFRFLRKDYALADLITFIVAVILGLVFISSSLKKAVELDKRDKAGWAKDKP